MYVALLCSVLVVNVNNCSVVSTCDKGVLLFFYCKLLCVCVMTKSMCFVLVVNVVNNCKVL